MHGSWETETFKRFWCERLTGFEETPHFQTVDTAAGNIMEAEILKAVGVPQECWNIYFPPKETMAGINTDAFWNNVYEEAKCILFEEASRWAIGYNISSAYMCQLKHGLFVTGAKEGRLHVCMMYPHEKKNPFTVDAKERTITFIFDRAYFDFPAEVEKAKEKGKESPVTMWHYGEMMKYLTECYNKGVFPKDAKRKEILNQFFLI